MSGINSTLTSDERIVHDDDVVKAVDLMTREDLQREVRGMDLIAFENVFGEEKPWTTSI